MKKDIAITNKDAKALLAKTRSLMDITKGILEQKESALAKSFQHIPFIRELGHNSSVWSVAITPDGKRIVSGSWDETVKIWDLQSGEYLATLEGHSNLVTSVAITPDGKRIVLGSSDKTVRIWDFQSGKCLATLEGSSSVWSVAITTDGRRIVSGSRDDTIKIWDYNAPKNSDRNFFPELSA